jgi:mono/diheme cytochrome c family protein
MKRLLKYVALGLVTLVVLAVLAGLWAYSVANSRYERQWTVHESTFPIPFALSGVELDALRADRIAAGASAHDPLAGLDLRAVALERAVERGRHLVESRTGCNGCHGDDLGGVELVDEVLVGRWVAPNLTLGDGSVTRDFTANDWDRAVRHGVRHNGRSSSMPSIDFLNLSDHELSDIVAYIRSVPAVNRRLETVRIGPLIAFAIATDPKMIGAFGIDHEATHAVEPPAATSSVELGRHIAQVCRGCHGPQLSGGKLAGDPAMPFVPNLTPHESGLESWSESDFMRALREGKRQDGTSIDEAMPWRAYGQMTDTELKAIWAYLQTVPPVPEGNR